jgi:hypothetical protein
MERTEEAIKNGQFRDIDNIFCTRHRTKTNKAQKTQHRKVAEKGGESRCSQRVRSLIGCF